MAAKSKEKSNIISTLWSLLLMIVIMLSMLTIFVVKSNTAARSTVESSLFSVVNQCGSDMQRQFDLMTETAVPSASHMEYVESYPEKGVQEICAILQYKTVADRVMICSEEGTGYWDTGETYEPEAIAYLDQIFSDDSKHTFQLEREDGKQFVVSCIPFVRNAEQWYIVMYYDLSHFYQIAEPILAGTDAFAVIIDRDGNILAANNSRSKFVDQKNLFAFNTSKNDELQRFITRLRSRSTASVSVSYDGEERVLMGAPMGTGEMDVVVGFHKDYVEKKISQVNKNARTILWELVAVMAVFMCYIVGISILNIVRHSESKKSLEEKADTDLLTGLNNKLATERKIKEYIKNNQGSQCIMVLMDLDNFKKINDSMGHAFGDEVLRTLGKQISGLFRMTDILGRIGGDEFMVFLKGMNGKDDIIKQADKITEFFKDFQAGTYVKYSSTASVGVSIYPRDAKNFEDLYKAADKALYKAKENGKNQLAFYNDDFLNED